MQVSIQPSKAWSLMYRGVLIERTFPSGYYTFYDPKTGRFLRFDDLVCAKNHITQILK
jgi:hypothetical protein